MRKLGDLNSMSVKAGDVIRINSLFVCVNHVNKTPSGYIEISTEEFGPMVYNPVEKIGIYCES